MKCNCTRAETRFRLSAKRTSPFKSAGASVQSTTGSRVVRISVSNARYTMFRGSVKGTSYPLHSPVSPSLPLPCVTVCHHISTESTDTSFSKCCEIYVHHSPRQGRFTIVAINATAWGHAFREGPEKSGFISEFTSSIFLSKFCRGPGTIPCGIFGGKK